MDRTAGHYLYRNGRPASRLPSELTDKQAPGLGGNWDGLGFTPREAIATAMAVQVAGVGATQVAGNYHAWLPPPDKFMIVNLQKVAPINRPGGKGTQATQNPNMLRAANAPVRQPGS